MDQLERTFREMRAADQMRSSQGQQRQRPDFWQVSAEAARDTLGDPMRAGSVFAELAYGVEDIRQKVVEAPTYGQEVTPSLHDGRDMQIARAAGEMRTQGGASQEAGPASTPERASGWDQEPTDKQAGILRDRGLDPKDYTRGTASQTIAEMRGYGASWYQQPGNDPLMRAYAERREVKSEELYGKAPEQAKEADRSREGLAHER